VINQDKPTNNNKGKTYIQTQNNPPFIQMQNRYTSTQQTRARGRRT
jgi:hypothetical protein